uniref:Post-GPI attachment to proteins factor 3 n=1 Tax=Glossina pallidipes TaxID=7398 RepID=A0A1A9ZPB9_GLOPL
MAIEPYFLSSIVKTAKDKIVRLAFKMLRFVSLGVLSYYVNYFAYLRAGKFSYSCNMGANVATVGLSMSLELLDFRPILWIFEAHALWHL